MSIDWANLVAKGRAKAIGVSWTEEEAAARAAGVPAEFVRDGVLTVEDYEKAKAKDDKQGAPTRRQPRKKLEKEAKELKIEFTPDVTDEVLADLIEKAKAE